MTPRIATAQYLTRSTARLLCAMIMTGAAHAALDEIVVTATKRATDVQDVPITMQALGGDTLQAMGARAAEDVLWLSANLSVNGSNEANRGFTIRGVGTNNFHGNVNRAVGIYQDEVSMTTPFSGVLGVYDMARVEILRGPQNTLFGRNTTGGAINYITNAPRVGEGYTGYALATLGEDAQADLEGALGFDLGETAAGRFAFQSLNRDGLFRNRAPGREGERLGDLDRQSARLQLLWQPRAGTDLLLNAHVGYDRGGNIGNKAIGLRDPNDPSQPCSLAEIARGSDYETRNDCAAANGFNPSSDDWRTVYNASGAQAKIDVEGAFLKVTHELGGGRTLTSITAVENTNIRQADDTGGFDVVRLTPNQDGDYEQYSQELRIASSDDARLRWLAGALWLREDMLLGTNVVNGGANVIASNLLEQEDTDRSLYGQIDFDATDQLTLGLGLRYADNTKRAPASVFRVIPRVPNGLTDPTLLVTNDVVLDAAVVARTIRFTNLEADLSELGGRAWAAYAPVDDVLVYGSYSRGFKAGGFDTRAIAALTPGGNPGRPVEPEFLDAWELGVKSTVANGALRLNAATFYYDWEDLQTFVVVGGVPGFANVPRSRLVGLDVEAAWQPVDHWQVTASVGLLDTEVTDAGGLTDSVDEGHELTNAPRVSANLSVRRDVTAGNGRLTLRADLNYRGTQKDTLRFDDDAFSTKPSTTFVNARLSYSPAGDRYRIELWAENLTEERTCFDIGLVDNPLVTAGQLSSTGACSPSPGQRRFGLSARFGF